MRMDGEALQRFGRRSVRLLGLDVSLLFGLFDPGEPPLGEGNDMVGLDAVVNLAHLSEEGGGGLEHR